MILEISQDSVIDGGISLISSFFFYNPSPKIMFCFYRRVFVPEGCFHLNLLKGEIYSFHTHLNYKHNICCLQGSSIMFKCTQKCYIYCLHSDICIFLWSQSFQNAVGQDEATPDSLKKTILSTFEPLHKFHIGFLREVEQRLALW